MKGYRQLIDMRLGGNKPSVVFIETFPDIFREWSDWENWNPGIAKLLVEEKDNPSRLDFRCLIGLTVLITGEDSARVNAVADTARRFKAGRVETAVVRSIGQEYRRFEVIR